MARGKSSPKPSAQRNVEYVNVDLSKERKAELVEWCEKNPQLIDQLEKTLDSGLRLGAAWDSYNECFQASLTQLPERGSDGTTLVLMGRGATVFQALQALMFKYWVILEQELEDSDQRNPRGITDWG